MAAESELTPTSYIQHHLTFLTTPSEAGGFWSVNVDTVVTSVVIGVIAFGLMWMVARKVTTGVPSKTQAFVELLLDFVNEQVKGIFHGDLKTVAPLSLTVFVWVILMNAMDFLPIDVMGLFYEHVLHQHNWRGVPTADVNTTFALALSVFGLMIFYGIKVKGVGGWIHELFCAPFGSNPLLWPANLLFNAVEYISKPLSHSLRLFGNMYAGEIIFMLLGLFAASVAGYGWFGIGMTFFWSAFFSVCWAIFHILIVALQAYIFMMLTIVYVAMGHEHH